ncbi:hypothetical protein [Qipengyuania flava]|uniref:hypothetical protein n=1 Tax=Qipengyuania flava TaxID=192812 RepID=UPI001C6373EF|nr:hypothetical protein [Qipengyuania flava]QYJ08199.1 hypothetical protein KUV82_05735 [Qipengyuania flava]
MHFEPTLETLRGDGAAQHARQAKVAEAVAQCREDAALQPVLEALEAYGAGAALEDCAALVALCECDGAARDAMTPLVDHLVTLFREEPLAELLFRHQSREGFHLVQLAGKGRATLSLALHEERDATQDAPLATFPDAERHEIVLAGAADLELVEILADHGERVAIDREPRRVVAGECLAFSGPDQSRRIVQVHGLLLTLRLARIPAQPRPTRQFDLATGRLVHRASGDRRESRQEMMIALLGRMGRSDAAPVLADAAREGSAHFRWQALRECLALDAGAGFPVLRAIAADPLDPLAAHAGAVQAQLLEAHPELARLEATPCPA